MTTGTLLPLRPRPEPDELFSSWVIRLASANGMAYVPFLKRLLPGALYLDRDLDWTASMALLEAVSGRSGLPLEQVHRTTLQTYRGRLFAREIRRYPGRWLLHIRSSNHSSVREGRLSRSHGLQFCPDCLTGPLPYFRLGWRLAFNTTCAHHGRVLLDRCPACGRRVIPTRSSPALSGVAVPLEELAHCADCRLDLRELSFAPYDPVEVLTEGGAYRTEKYWGWVYPEAKKRIHGVALFQERIDRALDSGFYVLAARQIPVQDFMAGLAHLAHMLTNAPGLDAWRRVVGLGSAVHLHPVAEMNVSFGSCPVDVRHAVMRALSWLLNDWPSRFHQCCTEAKISRSRLFEPDAPVRWLVDEADRYDGFVRQPHLRTLRPWDRDKFPR